jgi:hypothetical protein
VVDAAHNQESHQDVHLFIGNIQRPPRFLTPDINSSVEEGTPFSVNLQATDPNPADHLVFSLNGAPVGATIDPRTGLLTWTPPLTYVSTVGGTRPATFTATVTDGNASASLNINLSVADVTIVHVAEWNRGACLVRGDLTEVSKLVTTYTTAAKHRHVAKSLAGLTAALIAAVTPFGDKIGGRDLPLGLGLGAAVVGVVGQALPDPGARERQVGVLQRAQVELQNADQNYNPVTTDVRDQTLLQIRTDAMNTRTRVAANLQDIGITVPSTTCR